MTSPMQRTLAEIKSAGLKYWRVEHWHHHMKRRIDLFNIIDVLVLEDTIVGIQVCGSDFQPHIRKITEDEAENARAWLETGARLEVWGWRKLKKKRGGKAMEWKPRVADILLVDGELYVEEREAA